jgi:hypothetical protein
LVHQNIIWNDAAVKKHGNHEKILKKNTPRHIFPGKRIRREKQQHNRCYRSAADIKKGIEKRSPQLHILKNRFVSPEGKIDWPENNSSLDYGLGRTEGTGDAVDERIEHQEQGKPEPETAKSMEQFVRIGKPRKKPSSPFYLNQNTRHPRAP